MDFINKAWTQIADVFKGLTPGTRIAAGLLAAGIVVGLFYLFQYQAAGSSPFPKVSKETRPTIPSRMIPATGPK